MIVARFSNADALRRAAQALHRQGVPHETYSPAPIDQNGGSPLPLIIMLAGVLGAAASFALQTYSSVVAYPIDIGNRPLFAWPSFIPTAFENGVLLAVIAGVAGYLAINRMPRLHDVVDEAANFREASRDGWFIAADDSARTALEDLHPLNLDQVQP